MSQDTNSSVTLYPEQKIKFVMRYACEDSIELTRSEILELLEDRCDDFEGNASKINKAIYQLLSREKREVIVSDAGTSYATADEDMINEYISDWFSHKLNRPPKKQKKPEQKNKSKSKSGGK